MKLISKSEWFEFPSPIGEPEIKWTYNYPYSIERIVKEDGEIVWFGQGTNWVKKKDSSWTYLGVDENVKPLEVYYKEDGTIDGATYPEGRNIFIPCEPPIYEKMYTEKYGK
jgi:hypothetical protein